HARFATIISRVLMREAERHIGADLPPVINLAPMGVDLDQIRRSAPWQAPEAAGPIRIFSCGRLNAVKGHDHLVDVISLLRDRGLDVRLEIAGEDEQGGSGYRRELEAL